MRYVIALDAALRLFRERSTVPENVTLVAPSLLRSQVVAHLYRMARRGEIDRAEAKAQLDHMRSLNIRLFGDRVLQSLAWEFAERLGWEDTFTAEYIALTKLQADGLVTLSADLAKAAGTLVPVASFDEALSHRGDQPSS